MGSVFQHWSAHSSTFTFNSCLLTQVESLRRLFRSTTIRCSLRTLGVLSSSAMKASTRARGGYTPFTLAQEIRRLCKKAESSGASSRSSSFNRSCSTGWSWASSPLKQAPYFKQTALQKPIKQQCKQNESTRRSSWVTDRKSDTVD